MNNVYFSPTRMQVTLAQIGEAVKFGRDYDLVAVRLEDGWKYIVSSNGQVAHVCYAGNGYEAAINALNDDDRDLADMAELRREQLAADCEGDDDGFDDAYIEACELDSPNSLGFDSLVESIRERHAAARS